jgi:hypothetical protein
MLTSIVVNLIIFEGSCKVESLNWKKKPASMEFEGVQEFDASSPGPGRSTSFTKGKYALARGCQTRSLSLNRRAPICDDQQVRARSHQLF